MEGDTLIELLAGATGLPKAWVDEEVRRQLTKRGLNPATITLDSLREVLADLMQETLLSAKTELAK